jgi:hypothetical protein
VMGPVLDQAFLAKSKYLARHYLGAAVIRLRGALVWSHN